MKKILIIAIFLFAIPVLARDSVFEAHDYNSTVLQTSNIKGMACYCNATFLDPAVIILYGTGIPSRLEYDTRDRDCYKDYDRLKEILKQNAYMECVKHGGGNACKNCL